MRFASLVGTVALSLSCVGTAEASVTIYTTQSAFTAATTVTNLATFDGVPTGRLPSLVFVQDGIRITSIAGGYLSHTLSIVPAGSALVTPAPTTAVMSSDGDENYEILLNTPALFGAIGFNVYSNAYGPRTISLYGNTGNFLGSYAATQPTNSLGFFGLVSTIPIAYITTIVDRGGLQNTAIDNVQIGFVAAVPGAVPEPGAWIMMMLGFGLVGASLRRRSGVMLAHAV